MSFNELITHLFNLKVLATLDVHKSTVSEYIKSIKQSKMLLTEANSTQQDHNLNARQVRQIIEKSGELSFQTFEDETKTEITHLLEDIEIKEPLFGGVGIELKNILNTIKKSKELREYIFGIPVILQSGYFGKEPFNKQFEKTKTEKEILSDYMHLKDSQLDESFIEYLKLLERIKTPLSTSLETLKIELEKALKNKSQEEKRTYIRAIHSNNKEQLNKHPYLVVSTVSNYDYNNEISLASFLYSFVKGNGIELDKLVEIKPYFTTLFFDEYIKIHFTSLLESIQLEKDEFTGLFDKRIKLSKHLYQSYIEPFRDIERQLIDESYFDNSAKWKKGTNKKLVELILHCHKLNYFKIRATTTDNKELSKLRRFFEIRYSIKLGKQFQPHQRNSIEIPSYEFRWITKPS